MIIELLLNVVYTLVDLLTAAIDIPGMPEAVSTLIAEALEYIITGLAILANWTDLGYLLTLYSLDLAVDGGLLLYKLIMWFLRKIPMLGIE